MESIQYLNKMGDYRQTTREEEQELLIIANDKSPDRPKVEVQDALNTIIKSQMRLIISVAKRRWSCGHDLDDMISDGIDGLMKAISMFDYSQSNGARLSTYAIHWVKYFIDHGMDKTIKIPVEVRQWTSKWRKAAAALENGATDAEIAEKSGLKPTQVIAVKRAESIVGGGCLESAPATTQIDQTANMEYIAERLTILSERDQQIVKMRFGIGYEAMSYKKIGKLTRLSREKVKQICLQSINDLREVEETGAVKVKKTAAKKEIIIKEREEHHRPSRSQVTSMSLGEYLSTEKATQNARAGGLRTRAT